MTEITSSQLTADNRRIWEASPQLFVDRRVEIILEMLPHLGPDATVLDIGCLEGTLTRLYAKKVGTSAIHGIDVASADEARRKGVNVTEFDLNSTDELPYPEARFDVVLCIETLEHIYPTDHLVRGMHRILRPGGIKIIDVSRLDSFLNVGLFTLGFQPPGIECSRRHRFGAINKNSVLTGHAAYFTRRALLEMLRHYGFRITEARQVGQRSGWMKLQETRGNRINWMVRFLWWLYDLVSLRKEYLVVKAERS